MSTSKHSGRLRTLWLAAGGLLCAVPVMAAGPSVATVNVTLKKDPVSVSQIDKTFYATYNVIIANTSNASVNYKLSVNTRVMKGPNVPADVISNEFANFTEATAYTTSRGGSCKPANSNDLTVVTCADIDVSKITPQTISMTFSTPVVVNNLVPDRIRLNWSVTFQNQAPVAGYKDVMLTTIPDSQTTTEFFTTVPTTGGIFWTGFSAGPGAPVGGVATSGDLFTTTVKIPKIVNSTTASAKETQGSTNPAPSGCQNYYLNCFATTLDIPNIVYPSDSEAPYMTITLRVNQNQISAVATRLGINNIPIYYKHDLTSSAPPLPVQFCNDSLPKPGNPCISETKVWGTGSDVSEQYRGDWQWEFRAVDNGRFNT
jgi:hypothetical protein